MSKIYLKRVGFHLLPTDQASLIALKKLPLDKPLSCEVKQTRNYQFHKKFMALVKIGHENSKTIDAPFDVYRKYVTIRSGHYKSYSTAKGNFIEADSISFGSMDAETFEKLYKSVLDYVCADIGSTSEEVEQNLINFM